MSELGGGSRVRRPDVQLSRFYLLLFFLFLCVCVCFCNKYFFWSLGGFPFSLHKVRAKSHQSEPMTNLRCECGSKSRTPKKWNPLKTSTAAFFGQKNRSGRLDQGACLWRCDVMSCDVTWANIKDSRQRSCKHMVRILCEALVVLVHRGKLPPRDPFW